MIVQAGKQFTADELKATCGNLAMMLTDILADAMQLNDQLQSWSDADLVAMGLTQAEVNAQKGYFVGDMPAIYQANLNSVWRKQLVGTGV